MSYRLLVSEGRHQCLPDGSFPGHDELLSKLGKHKTGKACLYIRKLSDVDVKVLEQLVAGSVAEVKRRHG